MFVVTEFPDGATNINRFPAQYCNRKTLRERDSYPPEIFEEAQWFRFSFPNAAPASW